MGEKIKHPLRGDRIEDQEVILVTGSSGLIGYNLIQSLAPFYRVVGLDNLGPPYPPPQAECVNFDITDLDAIASAMERIRYGYGEKIAAVIHLAAYYSFKTEDSDLYDEITVEGTRKFLSELQDFEVEQFIFSSTDLIYKPTEPGIKIHEDCPVEPGWGYPRSKIITEELINKERGKIPALHLRIAGAYDEFCHSIPISHQIQRIYEKDLTGHFYAGDLNHGDVFVHLNDVIDAIEKAIARRKSLPTQLALNIGEPETPTYGELQERIAYLLYGEEWKTYTVPKPLAKAGAWAMDIVGDPFIKPWMIDRAGEHYELDIRRAKEYLDWEPQHRLMDILPLMIEHLKADPLKWYAENNLNPEYVKKRK